MNSQKNLKEIKEEENEEETSKSVLLRQTIEKEMMKERIKELESENNSLKRECKDLLKKNSILLKKLNKQNPNFLKNTDPDSPFLNIMKVWTPNDSSKKSKFFF